MANQKKVIIIGGGTFNKIAPHISLATPAFGKTARTMYKTAKAMFTDMSVQLHLTKMADSRSKLVTNEDVSKFVDELIKDTAVKVIIFNAAMCDFKLDIHNQPIGRLSSAQTYPANMVGIQEKVIGKIRKKRKDIFCVGFKTTFNQEPTEMIKLGLNLLKKNSLNLVIANDIGNRQNMIITPEEGVYSGKRNEIIDKMLRMVYWRSHLTFTRSTVVDGNPIPWHSHHVPENLRDVVNWLVLQGAYKTFNGATTGHFAAKIKDGEYLTSIRKTNFNDIEKNGMVHVKADGDDSIIAYGVKPSVGGQSQRIIFNQHEGMDCIVHFHCPLKERPYHNIHVVSQEQYECGSHECGANTADGLREYRVNAIAIKCVMLDNHGPNIVFSKSTPAWAIIDFIRANFDLSKPTHGYSGVYLDHVGE